MKIRYLTNFQRVDKPIDTLSGFEKGRYILRTSIRRRTLYDRVEVLKKQVITRDFRYFPRDYIFMLMDF